MCGIIGAYGPLYHELSEDNLDRLKKRGPDGQSFFREESENIALGHARLAIIDLSEESAQPMHDGFDRYTIVFNGEIYNYQTIRNTLVKNGYNFVSSGDTEVVLKAFIEYGPDCLSLFRGMFAFCIYDSENKKLFIARDRLGIKPLIYGYKGKTLFFSSEIAALVHNDTFKKRLNDASVQDFLRFGSIRQPKTIYKGLSYLMPGHYIEHDFLGEPKIKQYYKLSKNLGEREDDFLGVKKTLKSKLLEAAELHMVADVEVGAFLSGGVDSSAAVALMSQVSSKKVNTFSIGFDFNSGLVDETPIAKRTSEFLGTNHEEIILNEQSILDVIDEYIQAIDQPCYDGINSFLISNYVGKGMKVAVSGLGGDEIFSGYPHFDFIPKYVSKKMPIWASVFGKYFHQLSTYIGNSYSHLYGLSIDEQLFLKRSYNDTGSIINFEQIDETMFHHYDGLNLSPHQKISLLEIDNYLLNTLLRDGDVLSMAGSLELRPILLDHELVEYAMRIDDSLKIKNGIQKYIFIQAMEKLIPSEVWNRKKTGFSMPFKSWLNGPLRHEFMALIDEAPSLYDKFKKSYLSDLRFRAKSSSLLNHDWMIFVFLKWLKQVNKL